MRGSSALQRTSRLLRFAPERTLNKCRRDSNEGSRSEQERMAREGCPSHGQRIGGTARGDRHRNGPGLCRSRTRSRLMPLCLLSVKTGALSALR